jgi:hypothetical protein
MTYRDQEQALRARVDALRDERSQIDENRLSLDSELAIAEAELAAVEGRANSDIPKGLLLWGAVGSVGITLLTVLSSASVFAYAPLAGGAIRIVAAVMVGLGFWGIYRLTQSSLAQALALMEWSGQLLFFAFFYMLGGAFGFMPTMIFSLLFALARSVLLMVLIFSTLKNRLSSTVVRVLGTIVVVHGLVIMVTNSFWLFRTSYGTFITIAHTVASVASSLALAYLFIRLAQRSKSQ